MRLEPELDARGHQPPKKPVDILCQDVGIDTIIWGLDGRLKACRDRTMSPAVRVAVSTSAEGLGLGGVEGRSLPQELGVAADDGQQVVEIVGDSAGQHAEALRAAASAAGGLPTVPVHRRSVAPRSCPQGCDDANDVAFLIQDRHRPAMHPDDSMLLHVLDAKVGFKAAVPGDAFVCRASEPRDVFGMDDSAE